MALLQLTTRRVVCLAFKSMPGVTQVEAKVSIDSGKINAIIKLNVFKNELDRK
jgi:hypothetical protein